MDKVVMTNKATTSLKPWLVPFVASAADIIDAAVSDVRMDSRDICLGDVFVAIKGLSQDGINYIGAAINKGAVAVLVDVDDLVRAQSHAGSKAVQVIGIEQLCQRFAHLLAAFYPAANDNKIIGITGTNGKTTTAQLIAQLAGHQRQRVSVIGTLGVGFLDALQEHPNTTPGIADNYRLLDSFNREGSDYVAMEVTSQGLAQGRVSGIDYGCVVFTNLTQDHLDYHGDLDTYTAAKKQLFEQNPAATTILNCDDPVGASWFKQWRSTRKLIAVGSYDAQYTDNLHVMFKAIDYTSQGLEFTLVSSWGEARVKSPLYGRFNLNNLVTAIAVLLSDGEQSTDDEQLSELVEAVTHIEAIPGRMEQFSHFVEDNADSDKQAIVAVVDFAHTPDALAQTLLELREHTNGKLWCIFGCGGDRDKSKRPLMGQMAKQYADHIVLTNDNPRHEVPEQIVIDIQNGLANPDDAQVELDRKVAISNTLAKASPGDVILIAGKGHETYQVFGDQKTDYDERVFVAQCIGELST
jgi:UDP-N-acetylmuramoyl-L-alanyl-D-glutamate--2,6-diaminopimelate ligase